MDWDTDTLRYATWTPRLARVRQAVIAAQPGRVLELGCSTGLLRSRILTALPDIDYWCCDIAPLAVAAVGEQSVVWDVNDGLPFDGGFDLIVAAGILEYVHDLGLLFDQAKDRLNPAGSLIASYYNMRNPVLLALRWAGKEPPQHEAWVNDLSRKDIEAMLARRGFTVSVQPTVVELPKIGRLPLRSKVLAKEHLFVAVTPSAKGDPRRHT